MKFKTFVVSVVGLACLMAGPSVAGLQAAGNVGIGAASSGSGMAAAAGSRVAPVLGPKTVGTVSSERMGLSVNTGLAGVPSTGQLAAANFQTAQQAAVGNAAAPIGAPVIGAPAPAAFRAAVRMAAPLSSDTAAAATQARDGAEPTALDGAAALLTSPAVEAVVKQQPDGSFADPSAKSGALFDNSASGKPGVESVPGVAGASESGLKPFTAGPGRLAPADDQQPQPRGPMINPAGPDSKMPKGRAFYLLLAAASAVAGNYAGLATGGLAALAGVLSVAPTATLLGLMAGAVIGNKMGHILGYTKAGGIIGIATGVGAGAYIGGFVASPVAAAGMAVFGAGYGLINYWLVSRMRFPSVSLQGTIPGVLLSVTGAAAGLYAGLATGGLAGMAGILAALQTLTMVGGIIIKGPNGIKIGRIIGAITGIVGGWYFGAYVASPATAAALMGLGFCTGVFIFTGRGK